MREEIFNKKHFKFDLYAVWLLDRLKELKQYNSDYANKIEEMFDDDVIQNLLGLKNPILIYSLLLNLKARKFKNLINVLCKIDKKFDKNVYRQFIRIYTQLEPKEIIKQIIASNSKFDTDDLVKIFSEFLNIPVLNDSGINEDLENVFNNLKTDVENLDLYEYIIPLRFRYLDKKWSDHLKEFFDQIIILKGKYFNDHRNEEPIGTDSKSVHFKNNNITEISKDTITSWNKFEKEFIILIRSTFLKLGREISNNDFILHHIYDIIDENTNLEFSSLSKYFKFSFGSRIDRILSLKDEDLLKSIVTFFLSMPKSTIDYLSECTEIFEYASTCNESFIKNEISYFVLSLILSEFTVDFDSYEFNSFEEPFSILSLDLFYQPFYNRMLEFFRNEDKAKIIKKLINRLKSNRHNYCGKYIINIMADLGYEEFSDVLMGSCRDDDQSFIYDSAELALKKIGNSAEKYILNKIKSYDDGQMIIAINVLSEIGSENSIELLINVLNKEEKVDEMWYDFASTAVDEKLIRPIEKHLIFESEDITFAYLINCIIFEKFPPDFTKKYSDYQKYSEHVEDTYKKLYQNIPSDEPFDLELICKNCNTTGFYRVENLYIGRKDPQNDYLIGNEILCRKCNEYSEFEMTEVSSLYICNELFKILECEKKKIEYKSLINFSDFSIKGNLSLGPRSAFEYYVNALTTEPDKLENLIGFGNICRFIGRNRLGIDHYSKALKLDENSVEAAYGLAVLFQHQDRFSESLKIIETIFEKEKKWSFYRLIGSRKDFVAGLEDFYYDLKIQSGDLTDLVPRGTPRSVKTVSRNDPCPCGSGKKYKKCCLLKE